MILDIIKITIWPILIILLCLLFRGPISELIRPSLGQNLKVKIGTGGVEIERAAAAAAAVAAGAAARADKDQPLDQEKLASNLAQGIEASLSNTKQTQSQRKILWADDTPSNNDYLVNVFHDLGIDVKIAKSTEEAERALSDEKFDVVITDMSRPPDDEAGLKLVKFIHDRTASIPIIIYASYWASKHKGQEKQFGASLITNDPSSVYAFVLKKLLSR